MKSFWEGFEKRAAGMPGVVSGLGHYGSRTAGRVIGARPSPMMTTGSAFKPNPLPTPTLPSPSKALASKVQTTTMSVPKQHARGVSSMVI